MPTRDGLTKEQREELNVHIATDKMFDLFPLQVAGYEPLKDEVAVHRLHINALNALLPEKMRNTVIITVEKNEKRLAIEEKYHPICSITLAYAIKTGNTSLAAAMKLGMRNISYVADLNFLVTIVNINQAITPIIADADYVKFCITALMLSSGLTDATTFSGSLGANRQAMESVSVATSAVEKLFIPLRQDKTIIDLMMEYYNPKGGIKPDENFYTSITSSLIVNHLAHAHTVFDGHVFMDDADKTVIKGAHIKNMSTGKLAVSDLVGYFNLTKFRGGLFEFEVSAAGFQTKTVVVTIVVGKHLTMDFMLAKKF